MHSLDTGLIIGLCPGNNFGVCHYDTVVYALVIDDDRGLSPNTSLKQLIK